MAQIVELVTQNVARLIGGEFARRDHVGQKAGHHQQSQHDPEQMRHFEAFLLRSCLSFTHLYTLLCNGARRLQAAGHFIYFR